VLLNKHLYGDEFFDYIERGAQRSAKRIVPLILEHLKPRSVVDVGCGRGVWVAEWVRAGISDCIGLDGDYHDHQNLAIPSDRFRAVDLSEPFDLGRTFDIVQSLEVAEHIQGEKADVFLDNLCRHGQVIVFSAAVPGQGGEMHVNEQPLEYWRDKFHRRDYAAFDWLRRIIVRDSEIEPWYRYNTLLFATERASTKLPSNIVAARLSPDERVPDFAPLVWRIRNATFRCLPTGAVNRLAKLKHKAFNLINR